MKNAFFLISLWVLLTCSGSANQGVEKVEASRCHVFIDYENIWTFEMVDDGGQLIPILNIITFGEEEQPLRPEQIHVYNRRGRQAGVEKFSIDTGVDGEPYVTNFLTVLESSFIGLDLVGDFDSFDEPTEVIIELGESEFKLQPVACLDFEMLAEQINQVNAYSPNLREDFAVLKIEPIGTKQKRRSGRR